MAKTVRSAKLDSATARAKLPPSSKPYFVPVAESVHLGYRKGVRTRDRVPGRWVVRRYLGNEKYAVEAIGVADDFDPADGGEVLTFHQAATKARDRAQAQERAERSWACFHRARRCGALPRDSRQARDAWYLCSPPPALDSRKLSA
jgi:hypothetical protein